MGEQSSPQSSTHYAEVLIDETREALLALSEGGRIRSCNRCAAELLGVSVEEALSRTLEELVLLPAPWTSWATVCAVADEQRVVGQIRLRKDGSVHRVEARVRRARRDGLYSGHQLRAQGVEAARTDLPILVVLELLMPGVDGFAFLVRFAGLRGEHRTPVVVWTAKDLTPAEEERLRRSATAVITKGSAAPSTLLEQLRPLMARAPGHGETSHEA
jgi:PAS domain S-box-containing protein